MNPLLKLRVEAADLNARYADVLTRPPGEPTPGLIDALDAARCPSVPVALPQLAFDVEVLPRVTSTPTRPKVCSGCGARGEFPGHAYERCPRCRGSA